MDNQKISVTPNGDTLKILSGQLPAPFSPGKYTAAGTINAPGEFFNQFKKHNEKNDFSRGVVEVDIKAMSITYRENIMDNQTRDVTIWGKLNIAPDLKNLAINTNTVYGSQPLADILKFNRRLFSDKDECMALVTNLKSFVAKVNAEIETTNNNQGNKKLMFLQNVKSDLKLDFVLQCPIFEQGPIQKFKVEIMFDLRDKNVEFWLESVEMKELIDDSKHQQIETAIEPFRGFVPVIYV